MLPDPLCALHSQRRWPSLIAKLHSDSVFPCAVQDLFTVTGYEVEVTPPDNSSAISQAEHQHHTIANAICSMLFATGLPLKFWPYALPYYFLIHDALPHRACGESAFTIGTGGQPNLSTLCVFGCRIYAIPPGKRDVKLDTHARPGFFLATGIIIIIITHQLGKS